MKRFDCETETVTTRIPVELVVKIKVAAAKRNVSGSDLVREALEQYFEGARPRRKREAQA